MGELVEVPGTGVDFAACEVANAFQAKSLHSEAAHHRAIDHGPAHHGVVHTRSIGKVTHEAAGEAIAGAGGVVHFLQGKRGDGKDAGVVHHHGAVFAALDDERLGAELE